MGLLGEDLVLSLACEVGVAGSIPGRNNSEKALEDPAIPLRGFWAEPSVTQSISRCMTANGELQLICCYNMNRAVSLSSTFIISPEPTLNMQIHLKSGRCNGD